VGLEISRWSYKTGQSLSQSLRCIRKRLTCHTLLWYLRGRKFIVNILLMKCNYQFNPPVPWITENEQSLENGWIWNGNMNWNCITRSRYVTVWVQFYKIIVYIITMIIGITMDPIIGLKLHINKNILQFFIPVSKYRANCITQLFQSICDATG